MIDTHLNKERKKERERERELYSKHKQKQENNPNILNIFKYSCILIIKQIIK